MPAELKELMSEFDGMGEIEYFDLTDPWLEGPG